jgi:hypothetical protein
VGEYLGSPQPHGDRQWRCESERWWGACCASRPSARRRSR